MKNKKINVINQWFASVTSCYAMRTDFKNTRTDLGRVQKIRGPTKIDVTALIHF